MDTHFSGIQNVEGSKNVPKRTWYSFYLEFSMSEIICICEAGRVRRSPVTPRLAISQEALLPGGPCRLHEMRHTTSRL